MSDGVVRFCRSRSNDRRCTRPLEHPGLHRHRTIMWSDATADPARCAGSGEVGTPVAAMPEGYPHGRALCRRCFTFVPLVDERLAEHDAAPADESDAEIAARRAWFNTLG
ncbi:MULTISPECIES: hypothetical protein [unclassified Microbacterium]|uniref:hypothetical protein n=1 Tax=unclassified Microbacterium TaxID=2609290 RepID=UPI00214C6631|nr:MULTISPECIES: hypothetical protein [unclassified Microbacterium]MCR2784542.1 hypothetical protein [Microbacterium sp. zg.B96]MDL5350537.1 hypothetical protein [Microbacterium sp. zg-YB36]WIM14647.1 hypothetical protein QNO11_08695 [Microbacterium sp. zg-B96]